MLLAGAGERVALGAAGSGGRRRGAAVRAPAARGVGQPLGERQQQLGEVRVRAGAPVAGHVAPRRCRSWGGGRAARTAPAGARSRAPAGPPVAVAGVARPSRLPSGMSDVDRHPSGHGLHDASGHRGAQARAAGAGVGAGRSGWADRGHRTLSSGAWVGRGCTGRRRSQSRMPCQRMSRLTRGSSSRCRAVVATRARVRRAAPACRWWSRSARARRRGRAPTVTLTRSGVRRSRTSYLPETSLNGET